MTAYTTEQRRNGARYQRGNRKLDLFAEALAETGEVALAAQAIGLTRDSAKKMLSRIRKELGWQAI